MRSNLRKSELDPSLLDALDVSQIPMGDLSNVAGFANDPRLDTVTHVLNCAAVASFSNHRMIWPVNVISTVDFAWRMSKVKTLLRFVHVGTAMACDTFREIERAMAEARGIAPLGERYRHFDASGIPALVPKFQERLGVRNRRLISMALKLYGGFSKLNYAFDNRRLPGEGMSSPPKFTGYIARCIEITRNVPLLEQMMDDFK